MKAIVYTKYGPPEVLELKDVKVIDREYFIGYKSKGYMSPYEMELT